MEFHIAGSFEFFKDDFVHPASGINQGGGNDRQAAAVFDISGRTEETLRFVQSIGIDTAGKNFSAGWNYSVVGARQTGDAIEQNDHIFFMFNEALGFFDNHFCYLHVTGSRFIKCGRNYFAGNTALHVGYFFRPFIN